jgi:predicted PurR-regulated permease PerM
MVDPMIGNSPPAPFFNQPLSKVFFWALFLFSLALGLLLLRPFLVQIFWAFALFVILKPFYLKVLKWFRRRKIPTALAMTLFILVLVMVPLIFLSSMVTSQALDLYQDFPSGKDGKSLQKWMAYDLEHLNNTIKKFLPPSLRTSFDLEKKIAEFIQSLSQAVVQFFPGLVKGIFVWAAGLLMVLFISFFLFLDGERFLEKIRILVPLEYSLFDELMLVTEETIKATLLSSLVIALLQGFLGGLGFWIFDIKGFAVWGALMTFTSLIPLVGTAIIWIPAAGILFFMGEAIKGFWLLLWGIFIVAGSDNIVRPLVIRGRLKIHPLFIFLSVLGGISLFGFSGLILGPLILSFIISLLKVYKDHLLSRPGEMLVEGEEAMLKEDGTG